MDAKYPVLLQVDRVHLKAKFLKKPEGDVVVTDGSPIDAMDAGFRMLHHFVAEEDQPKVSQAFMEAVFDRRRGREMIPEELEFGVKLSKGAPVRLHATIVRVDSRAVLFGCAPAGDPKAADRSGQEPFLLNGGAMGNEDGSQAAGKPSEGGLEEAFSPDTLMADSHIYIRTFGFFDVFVDGEPISFKNKKAKELLAILVDRRGGYVSAEEAISLLWEEEPATKVVRARYRKVAYWLNKQLRDCGAAEIVENDGGRRRIALDQVDCDLYQFLSGESRYQNLYGGAYMNNYSWGEYTLAELDSKVNK